MCKKLFLGLSACIQYDRDHRQGLQVCVHWYPQEAFLLMLSGNVSCSHNDVMISFFGQVLVQIILRKISDDLAKPAPKSRREMVFIFFGDFCASGGGKPAAE